MNVVNISRNDWANFSYSNAKAMDAVGITSVALVLNKHPFKYSHEAFEVDIKTMIHYCEEADVVNFVHNDIDLFNQLLPHIKNKKIIVTYTGSAYRNDPNRHNAVFNPHVEFSLTDQTEFMNLGAKNIKYISTAIDTQKFSVKEIGKQLKFAHYPSNPDVKGTAEIIEMMKMFDYDGEFACDTKILNHQDSIRRMSDCDIYIELFKPELNGKPYGCFGVTAFEAASLGKIVVTQNMNKEVYESVYGNSPFLIPETREQFKMSIDFLIMQHSINPNFIKRMQEMHREQMIKKHSYKAIGEQMKKLLS